MIAFKDNNWEKFSVTVLQISACSLELDKKEYFYTFLVVYRGKILQISGNR